jgi:hypothetical protein
MRLDPSILSLLTLSALPSLSLAARPKDAILLSEVCLPPLPPPLSHPPYKNTNQPTGC